MRVKILWLTMILIFGLALSACGSSTDEPAVEEPAVEAPAVEAPATEEPAAEEPAAAELSEVTFVATEYAYDGPESIPAGWTRLTLDNQGEKGHDLILIKLGEGKTMDDVMAVLASEDGPPEWISLYGGATAGPGESASYIVDLVSGQYAMFSFGSEENAPPDAAQGMVASLAVTEAPAGAGQPELPQADATVDLLDFAFGIQGAIGRGDQLLQVTNKGTETHEMVIFHLQEGMTKDDFLSTLMAEEPAAEGEAPADSAGASTAEPAGPPPFEQIGSTFLSPGVSTLSTVDFAEPGTYVFVCFLPSPTHDMTPHFAMGMVQEVTVQ